MCSYGLNAEEIADAMESVDVDSRCEGDYSEAYKTNSLITTLLLIVSMSLTAYYHIVPFYQVIDYEN